ncbi:hypothetical protein HHI36_020587 [Cryptolaemus montrouzieri]|uniref:GOST seven transmembrane domain-containing protein n=1 Tax=Cryptolaemus montrouzieri TaxID=559131 RepID=A0ABD2NCB3_9CUCU
MKKFCQFLIFLLLGFLASAKIHSITLKNDNRKYIALSSFGFYQGGLLDIKLERFKITPENASGLFGFTLGRTTNDPKNPYFDNQENSISNDPSTVGLMYFILELKQRRVHINYNEYQIAYVYKNKDEALSCRSLSGEQEYKRKIEDRSQCDAYNLDLTAEFIDGYTYYSTNFTISIESIEEEGFYNLYFYNCPNYDSYEEISMDGKIQIIETNLGTYLSAEEIPLSILYNMMSMLFSITGIFWLYVLLRCKQPVQKIHYMMAVLIFLHAISLALYSVNYHFMKRLGMNSPLWITMFYIMRFLNQMLFFVVLVLLGAGWNITKPVLIMREKVVLITVVILQISANVIKIISYENQQYIMHFLSLERADLSFNFLTFGCSLFPIIWSMKRCRVSFFW